MSVLNKKFKITINEEQQKCQIYYKRNNKKCQNYYNILIIGDRIKTGKNLNSLRSLRFLPEKTFGRVL